MMRKSLLAVKSTSNKSKDSDENGKRKSKFRGTLLNAAEIDAEQALETTPSKRIVKPKLFLGVPRILLSNDDAKEAETVVESKDDSEEMDTTPIEIKKVKIRRLTSPTIGIAKLKMNRNKNGGQKMSECDDEDTKDGSEAEAPVESMKSKSEFPRKRRKCDKSKSKAKQPPSKDAKSKSKNTMPTYLGDNWVPIINIRSVPPLSEIAAHLPRKPSTYDVPKLATLFDEDTISRNFRSLFPITTPFELCGAWDWHGMRDLDANAAERLSQKMRRLLDESRCDLTAITAVSNEDESNDFQFPILDIGSGTGSEGSSLQSDEDGKISISMSINQVMNLM